MTADDTIENQLESVECWSCLSLSGERRISPGRFIYEGRYWMMDHAYPTRLPGWLVFVLKRHAEALHDLSAEEMVEMGDLIRRSCQVLRAVTGCQKEYVSLYAEAPHFAHLHVHIVPRAPICQPTCVDHVSSASSRQRAPFRRRKSARFPWSCERASQRRAAPALCSEICARAPKGLPVPHSAGILEVDTFLRSRVARRGAAKMWSVEGEQVWAQQRAQVRRNRGGRPGSSLSGGGSG
jgi:diadenosine tetraphosphate (Ap4A) HIT family hydrolase